MSTVKTNQGTARASLGIDKKGRESTCRFGRRVWSSILDRMGFAVLLAIVVGVSASHSDMALAEGFPEVAVVTHQGVEIESVEMAGLSRLFLSLENGLDGVRLKAVNLSDPELKLSFLERVTGMSARQIERHFIQMELQGEGKWPPEVDSAEQLVKLIVKSRNVVGWLPVSELQNLPEQYRDALKVIAVAGHKPGDKGYLLGSSQQF